MERVTLSGLVKLAKYLSGDKTVYSNGIKIHYNLDITNSDLLQREIHFHSKGDMNNFKSIDKYTFEIIGIVFEFSTI